MDNHLFPCQAKDLAYRAPLYHPDFPVVIMWSQKSACTIAVKWFFHHIGLLDEALAYHRWVHNYENEVFKAQPRYLSHCLEAIAAGKPVIKLVRNPYMRAYSGFLETCHRRVLTDKDHWSHRTRKAVLRHATGSDAAIEYAYSFVQYCNWLVAQPAESLDPHIAPQFESIERVLNVKAVRIDGKANCFRALEKQYSLPRSTGIRKVHSSPHHHSKLSLPSETTIKLLELGVPVQRRQDFRVVDATPDTIAHSMAGEALRTTFRDDFEAYKYGLMPGKDGL